MRFGAYLYGDPQATAAESQALERAGFSQIWFGEVPTLGFGDAFQGMADAARATRTAAVGSAITVAGLRPPATLVTQLGSLNSAAPGRVTVGLGTGALTRKLVGLAPLRVAEFRAEVEQVRLLLDGEEGSAGGLPIAFREPRGGVRLDPPIRLLVAAGGPRTAALAGEFGDGLLASGGNTDPTTLAELRRVAEESATAAGRDPETLTFVHEAGPVCIVRDGEDLRSPRVLEIVEPIITTNFVGSMAFGATPEQVDPAIADAYATFKADAEGTYGSDPAALLFGLGARAFHRRPEYDRLLTPAVIEACTLTGSFTELRDRIAAIAASGATDIAVFRGRSYRWADGADLDEFARLIEAVG